MDIYVVMVDISLNMAFDVCLLNHWLMFLFAEDPFYGEVKFASICIYMGPIYFFVCVEVLRPSQPNGVMSSVDSLPSYTFTGQA